MGNGREKKKKKKKKCTCPAHTHPQNKEINPVTSVFLEDAFLRSSDWIGRRGGAGKREEGRGKAVLRARG